MAKTAYRHIVLDDNGFPVIEGANTKVVELVAEIQAHGLSPESSAISCPTFRWARFTPPLLITGTTERRSAGISSGGPSLPKSSGASSASRRSSPD